MDSTENESGKRIINQEVKSGDNEAKQYNTDSSKSAKVVDGEESVKIKWEHNQNISNNKMIELLTILKESVEGSVKQTEDQVNNYREVLKSFKP
jgi:hypothetical protein